MKEDQFGYVVGMICGGISANTQVIGEVCKTITRHEKFNRKVALFALLTGAYIVKNELRVVNQKAQIKRLQREIDTLNSSKENTKMKGE